MIDSMQIVDSHTGGEPTRVIISGGPDLGRVSMAQQREVFSREFDHIRTALIHEPRGANVMVGALLCEPTDSSNAAGVIFFNNVGFLGMCGHGLIGFAVTLYHLGKIDLGYHSIETPVGVVDIELLSASQVKINNVPSYRYQKDVRVKLESQNSVCGDIAWGGNWFYLIKHHQLLHLTHTEQLIEFSWNVRKALETHHITGRDGALIDHIELFCEPSNAELADSRNFVLCPGREFDRSPCGTGTSAKMACLYDDGVLSAGQIWRQESIIGSIFEGSVSIKDQQIIPQITGSAYVTQETNVIFNSDDPFCYGI